SNRRPIGNDYQRRRVLVFGECFQSGGEVAFSGLDHEIGDHHRQHLSHVACGRVLDEDVSLGELFLQATGKTLGVEKEDRGFGGHGGETTVSFRVDRLPVSSPPFKRSSPYESSHFRKVGLLGGLP